MIATKETHFILKKSPGLLDGFPNGWEEGLKMQIASSLINLFDYWFFILYIVIDCLIYILMNLNFESLKALQIQN